jgi:hypothetical protein
MPAVRRELAGDVVVAMKSEEPQFTARTSWIGFSCGK